MRLSVSGYDKAVWVFLLVCPSHPIFGQAKSRCLPQGSLVTIRGTLTRVNDRGYWRWISLLPQRPFCALADPTDEYGDPVDRVTAIQMFDMDNDEIRSRLERLAGNKVEATGELIQWHTGYQRSEIVLKVATVLPTDAAGRAILALPVPAKPSPRDVAAYEVTVRAGRSLVKHATEIGSKKPLLPVDEYAPHWVTGGEVVYIHCRDDYDVKFLSGSIAEGAALCGLGGNSCGFGIPEHGTITLIMRCTKAQ